MIKIIGLGFLMLIGGFLEMLSVSLILPFMEAIMQPEEIMQNAYVAPVCGWIGIEDHRTFLIFLAILMIIIYIVKNLFLLLEMYMQKRFVYNNMFSVQCRLLHSYLSRPYESFLHINSGEVLRVIDIDTDGAFVLLVAVLSMITELVTSGILVITVFLISPFITLGVAALLFFSVFFIMLFLRPILVKGSKKKQVANADMRQWLLQSIQGIKELKIMRKERFFEEQYGKSGKTYVQMVYQGTTLSAMPRYLIEAAAMSSLFVMIAVMLYQGMPTESVVPLLSVMAMASIRLLPAVNRISLQMADMAARETQLDKVIENMQEVTVQDSAEQPVTGDGTVRLEESIQLSQIRYRYPSGEKDILSDASLTVRKGQTVGIVGASGAGKTTAVDVMLGLLKPSAGQVLVDGTDIRLDMDGWLKEIGYIPQSIFMLDGSIRENVAFGVPAEEINDERVWEVLREASIDGFVRELSEGLDAQIGERGMRLSGGQRQRIGIARALYTDPSVLIFDEATSALDNETEAAIMESIEHLHGSKTMVIIAHRLTTIENCDRVYRVEEGKILEEKRRS